MIKTKTKKKIQISAIVILVLLLAVVGVFYYRISNQPRWENTSLTFELGDKIKIRSKDVLNKSDDTFQIDTSSISEKPGTYTAKASVQLFSGKEVRNIRITIEDSKAPTFTKAPKRISVNYGDEDYNFQKHFKVKDASKYRLRVNTKDVDFTTPGTYQASVIAEDIYGNTRKKTFKVVVRSYADYVPEDDQDENDAFVQQQDGEQIYSWGDAQTDSSSSNDASTNTQNQNPITPENYDTSQYDPSKGFNTTQSA